MARTALTTDRERLFPAEQRLISATDPRGVITYCNDEFAAVSGYSREELLGSHHNLVRHPDMPKAVFGHMWRHLKDGRPWMGIVKNRCKNGDFYWVCAYVTPIHQEGVLVGYESVRIRPEPDQVRRASALYAEVTEQGFKRRSQGWQRSGRRRSWPACPRCWRRSGRRRSASGWRWSPCHSVFRTAFRAATAAGSVATQHAGRLRQRAGGAQLQ